MVVKKMTGPGVKENGLRRAIQLSWRHVAFKSFQWEEMTQDAVESVVVATLGDGGRGASSCIACDVHMSWAIAPKLSPMRV